MPGDFSLSKASVGNAQSLLTTARDSIDECGASRPTTGFESVAGTVEASVSYFLRGLSVGRAALSDAALSANRSLSTLSTESSALDAHLAGTLRGGYRIRATAASRRDEK